MWHMDRFALSDQHKQELASLGVSVLYLFGSRARGVASERSDYDIGVVYADPHKASLESGAYGALYTILSDVFPDMPGDGPKLDIAILQRTNAALQTAAVRYGIVLFESDPRMRADYEESVVKRYDDYRFLQNAYEEANFAAFRAPKESYGCVHK